MVYLQPLVYSSTAHNSWAGPGESQDQDQDRNPGLPHGQQECERLSHHCCLSECTLVRIWRIAASSQGRALSAFYHYNQVLMTEYLCKKVCFSSCFWRFTVQRQLLAWIWHWMKAVSRGMYAEEGSLAEPGSRESRGWAQLSGFPKNPLLRITC